MVGDFCSEGGARLREPDNSNPDTPIQIFVKRNLSPLSFTDVPRETYTEAILGVYELNKVELIKKVFMWACERSAARYSAVRQSLGDPDPFRLRYRAELRELVGEIIRSELNRKETAARIAAWSTEKIKAEDRARFAQIAESEIASLHEGNFARYRVRPSEFAEWRKVWENNMTGEANVRG